MWRRPGLVERSLKHLGLWRAPEGRRGDRRGTAPLGGAQEPPELVYGPVDDGWPGYEEPTHTLHRPSPSNRCRRAVRARTVREPAGRFVTRLNPPNRVIRETTG
ncbi:MAG: hypothetical protein Kow0092_15150 [Deferrisomatales bacterium]